MNRKENKENAYGQILGEVGGGSPHIGKVEWLGFAHTSLKHSEVKSGVAAILWTGKLAGYYSKNCGKYNIRGPLQINQKSPPEKLNPSKVPTIIIIL